MVRSIFTPCTLARVAASAACMLPLASHALSEDPLTMVYEAPYVVHRDAAGRPMTPAPLVAKTCAVAVQLADIRTNKATLGSTTFMLGMTDSTPIVMQSIRGGDGLPWLRGAVLALQTQGFNVAENAANAGPAPLGIDVQLRLAQAWSEGVNLASTVIVEARYRAATGDVTRMYIGQGMNANWANGNGEFMSVLNAAMSDAVTLMAKDAATLCEGRTLAAALP